MGERLHAIAAILAAGAFGVGCGNGGDGGDGVTPVAACGDEFAACGGDLVGRWQVTDSCIVDPVQSPNSSCPDATVTFTEYEVSGTIEFTADGAAISEGSNTVATALRIPLECLQGTCAAHQESIVESGQDEGFDVTVSCSEVGSDCSCTIRAHDPASTDNDTYETLGNQVTVAEPDGNTIQLDYCVTGDTLVLRSEDDSMTLTRS